MCPIYPALCTTRLQLLLPGPPATSSRQCLPQTGQGQERAFTSLLRLPSSQPCLTSGYIRTCKSQPGPQLVFCKLILNQTVPLLFYTSLTPHTHLTHTPHTPHPHPTHTSPTHTLYPPFPSRTPAFMCVRCSSRNYTKDLPPVSCHCRTWQFSVSMAMRRTRH